MEKQNITVSQAHAKIGDAVLKLFRISVNKPLIKNGGNKLIHEHVYYECHLILWGETRFVIDDRTVNVRERQLLIIPPKQGHQPFESETACSGASECVFGLTLEPEEGEFCCYPHFHAALQQAACTPIALPDGLYSRLTEFLDGFDALDGGLRARCRQLTNVYPLLYSLFDTINGFEMPRDSEQKIQNADVAVTLDTMVNGLSCSLGDIASVLGYSYRHTARRIREVYGDSLGNVRRAKMLSSAKTLLVQYPEMTLERIAWQSGFTGIHTMIRAFRVSENMTPTEYRNKLLAGKNGDAGK